ncbi:DUF6191 domain-containing protein [Streptomyces acidicola]|uniref:DUF6191 domain-containing protein n=1 Tax=Streptomyces acidicola TaxID=2596892 RepID=UPI00378EB23F
MAQAVSGEDVRRAEGRWGRSGEVPVFNAFEELFAPGHKHTSDERNRLEMTREDVGDSDPARGPIDLESGTAVIRPSARLHDVKDPNEGEPDED